MVDNSDGERHRVCGGRTDADRQVATLFAGGVGAPPSPADHHLLANTASSRVAAAASRRRLQSTGRSATATHTVRTSPPAARRRVATSASSCTWVSNFGRFLTSKDGVDVYASIYGNFLSTLCFEPLLEIYCQYDTERCAELFSRITV